MSQFIELSDYDATIFRDILDTLVREDETLVEICEDRAIEEMRCYLSKRYDCNAIFNASGNARNQLILMMAIDIAVYHIFCIHNPQKLSDVRRERYERAVEWLKAVADERMRCLYITASPEGHSCVEALLNRLDSPGKQIMIEARLVEINDGARQEFESTLAAVYNGWIFSYGSAGLGGRYTYGNGAVTPNVDPTGSTRPGELPIIGGTDTDTSFPGYVADSAMKMVDAALRAMESDNKGKVLASPSVVALDGQKASVRLTHNYLYQSGVDENGNPEFTNQETGPMLEFTPALGRDGFITINMKISTGEIVAFRRSGDSEAPETTKREVDTRIRVRDGELFVIGGLYQENKTNNVTRVPVIGYIPLLGELFKTRTTQHSKSQMAFIAVPYILDIPSGAVEVIDMPSGGLRM